jgi:hypothetical protein
VCFSPQAVNALRAFGRTAEHQPWRPPGRPAIDRRPLRAAVAAVTTMTLESCAADGRPATSPRPATHSASALLVAVTLDVTDSRPKLTNSGADPEYSGTTWTRPLISAGSTSSRLPKSGKDTDGKPPRRERVSVNISKQHALREIE